MREITIVIPFYNGHQYIHNLIQTIPDNINTIIVDDVSDKKLNLNKPNITTYRLAEKGYFSGAVNYGIQQCNTDVLILNQDTLLSDGWQQIIEKNRDTYSMIGERIKGNHPLFHNGYIHGTFLFIARELINNIGLLNQELYPLWGNTAEYQLRASRAGYKVLPLVDVPGFNHLRGEKEAYGSSIKSTITKDNKATLIQTPPLISIIIPCHNYAHYLPDAINSLTGGETCLGTMPPQTLQSFEIIIVDDGSNKENQKQINSFVDGWNGIRVVRLDRNPKDKNGKYIGKPSALNAGINKAIGKYITVLDADDMMDSRRLETLYRLAIENPHSVIYDQILSFKQVSKNTKWLNERNPKNLIHIDTDNLSLGAESKLLSKTACENPKKTAEGNNLAFYFWRLPDYNFEQLIYKNCMHTGILFPKSAWVEIGGYNEIMQYGREDWAINIALGLAGYCGIKAEQPFYLYRREGQNRTLENTKPHWQERFRQQIQEIYYNVYRGERPMACCGRGSKPTTRVQNFPASMSLSAQDGLTYLKYEGVRTASFSVWGSSTGHQYRVNPKNPVFLVEDADLYTEGRHTGLLDMYEGSKYMFSIYEPVQQAVEKIEVTEVQPLQESFVAAMSLDVEDNFLSSFEEIPPKTIVEQRLDSVRYELLNKIVSSDLLTGKNLIYDSNMSIEELTELKELATENKSPKLLLTAIDRFIADHYADEAVEHVDINNGILPDKHTEILNGNLDILRQFLMFDSYSLNELNLMLEYEQENKNRKTAIEMLEMNIDEYDGTNLFNISDI